MTVHGTPWAAMSNAVSRAKRRHSQIKRHHLARPSTVVLTGGTKDDIERVVAENAIMRERGEIMTHGERKKRAIAKRAMINSGAHNRRVKVTLPVLNLPPTPED